MKASLPNIGGLPASSDLNYSTSKLIYRISYPTSGGIGIKHDPTYVEHYVPNLLTVSTPVPDFPIIIVYLATFTLSSDGCFQEPILINDYFDLVSSLVFPTFAPIENLYILRQWEPVFGQFLRANFRQPNAEFDFGDYA